MAGGGGGGGRLSEGADDWEWDGKLEEQEIFKRRQKRIASILLSLPHWIQHTSIRDENCDFGKLGKPLMKTGLGLPPLHNVANLI